MTKPTTEPKENRTMTVLKLHRLIAKGPNPIIRQAAQRIAARPRLYPNDPYRIHAAIPAPRMAKKV
jgi:hypothetical protein